MKWWPFKKKETEIRELSVVVVDGTEIAEAIRFVWSEYHQKVLLPRLAAEAEKERKKIEAARAKNEKQFLAEVKKVNDSFSKK